MKKIWFFLLIENMCTVESKWIWKHWWLKAVMWVAFKLKKISFNNVAVMKISAVFECNSTHSASVDTNLDTVRFYLATSYLVASFLAVQGRFKRSKEGKYLVPMEKMRQGKRKFERKKKRCNLCREEMEVTEELKIVKLL